MAGGHSIDSPEPIYGLAVIGIGRPQDIRRNTVAKPGDMLILTKALGVGIYSAAFKKAALSPAAYAEMTASMTLLNGIGTELAKDPAVHAVTDVTGFGLLGHALVMARGSNLALVVRFDDLPFLTEAERFAQQQFVTGASARNWASYAESVTLPSDFPEWRRHLLTDPQTSGGLLSCLRSRSCGRIMRTITDAGYPRACIIGHVMPDHRQSQLGPERSDPGGNFSQGPS